MKSNEFLQFLSMLIMTGCLLMGCSPKEKVDDNAAVVITTETPESENLTGIWLFTTTGITTENGKKSTEAKGEKLVLIKETENNTVTFESCESPFRPDAAFDAEYEIVSDVIDHTSANALGNALTFKLTFKDKESASGSKSFSYPYDSTMWKEDIKATKLSDDDMFKKQNVGSINLLILVDANKSVINNAVNFDISCYSVGKESLYKDDKEYITRWVDVIGKNADAEEDELHVGIHLGDLYSVIPDYLYITYTYEDASMNLVESEVEFYNERKASDEDADSSSDKFGGTIDIDSDYASIDVIGDDGQGNSATVDFSLNDKE